MEVSEKQTVPRKGHISEELQQQAKKAVSPVISEFLVASRKGFTQHVLQTLTEGGSAKAAIVDKHGRNCLQLAVLHGHLDTALAVLQTKLIDINSANRRGLTALHDACTEGHKHIALLLLAMGADVAAKTKDGWTCLMCACSNGHTQLAQLLIAAVCDHDINISTKLGLTALHIAAWKGHTSIVELLIQSGANLMALAHNGKTALQLAQEENQHECATILTAATSKQSEQPMYRIAALEGQLRMCQDKLVQSHRQQDELRKNERSRYEERVANLKAEFGGQLEEASQTITSLRKRVSELERCLDKATTAKSPPDIRLDAPTPPPTRSPATVRKRKHKKKHLHVNAETSPQTTAGGGEESEPVGDLNLNPIESRQRSASTADLRSIPVVGDASNLQDEDDGRRNGAAYSLKLSPDIQRSPELNSSQGGGGGQSKLTTQRRSSYTEKISITTLVEESLRNPDSIAAIRRQLKSEGLTPKIQRKFPMKPSTLPSMSPKDTATTKETSPLTKGSNKA